MNKSVHDFFDIIHPIGKGSFGCVYLAFDKTHGKNIAIKIANRNNNYPLASEYNTYRILKKLQTVSIPKLHYYITTRDFDIIAMDYGGSSLSALFDANDHKFKSEFIFFFAENAISILQKIHSNGIVHRDIKPGNFLIDNGHTKIILIDFGLSKKIVCDKAIIGPGKLSTIVGTARYASINMHDGWELSKRDDLESLGYVLIYFARGKLPWQNENGKNNFGDAGYIKKNTSIENLCKHLPSAFATYISYCRKLDFHDTPDYNFLISVFRSNVL